MRTHVTPITNDAMDGFPFGFSEVCGNVGGAEHAVRHPAERLAARKDDGFISPSEKRAHHLKSYASLQVVFADERDQDGATETASAPLASAKKFWDYSTSVFSEFCLEMRSVGTIVSAVVSVARTPKTLAAKLSSWRTDVDRVTEE
jgi:hypothetical protein